ncbi:uncharacterized protein LOC115748081 isoform X2 [Rhodamnia argentea]|uniref:Uncharacterized protein LOC115748081 isoform X2 n=1 Tax=Rhodamnia argentea TaxID=178133 RepID=A0ABM3HV24_9MYRT|nr:uncharacterized protein LOC115748081 isoform X2 [Rhodamnia argentea]
MASSAHKQQHHHIADMYGATSAPPPTPSTLSSAAGTDSVAAADFLSRLIHRLPPALSLPARLSPTTTDNPPNSSSAAAAHAAISSVSWSDEKNASFFENLSSASSVGFFQMTGHPVSSELARSAESESLALFDLPVDQKELYFPKNWPFGYERDEDDDRLGEWFCLDSLCSCSAGSSELKLESLRELALTMEKVGCEIIEWMSRAIGFENPVKENPARVCSLMWISKGCSDEGHERAVTGGGFYPFVVGLSYQIRTQKYSLLADSGTVTVSPEAGSLMVAIGDIAQVWSNGKLQKVRGRPVACGEGDSGAITMSLLVSLPLESTVSPLVPLEKIVGHDQEEEEEDISNASDRGKRRDGEKAMFRSFSFEDYAWRVYHERLIVSSPKDLLDGYRITNT